MRGEEVDLGEHIYLGGGGLREAENGTRLISSASFVSFKKSAVWHMDPDAMRKKRSQ